ncbi:16523_t:CDS:2, partial [Racocetra persica]
NIPEWTTPAVRTHEEENLKLEIVKSLNWTTPTKKIHQNRQLQQQNLRRRKLEN